MYRVNFTTEATKDTLKLRKSEPHAFRKLEKLLIELKEHPATGTGKPKPLSGDRFGQWLHRISDKHRLIYSIIEDTITVLVLSTYGHYDDK